MNELETVIHKDDTNKWPVSGDLEIGIAPEFERTKTLRGFLTCKKSAAGSEMMDDDRRQETHL